MARTYRQMHWRIDSKDSDLSSIKCGVEIGDDKVAVFVVIEFKIFLCCISHTVAVVSSVILHAFISVRESSTALVEWDQSHLMVLREPGFFFGAFRFFL